jgi:hypothetical protein
MPTLSIHLRWRGAPSQRIFRCRQPTSPEVRIQMRRPTRRISHQAYSVLVSRVGSNLPAGLRPRRQL